MLILFEKTYEEIANAALNAVDWNYQIPEGIKISVEKGWVTFRDEATWAFQKKAATTSMQSLLGVRGISNEMTIKTHAQTSDMKM